MGGLAEKFESITIPLFPHLIDEETDPQSLGDLPKVTQLVANKWQNQDLSPKESGFRVCALSYYNK